MSRVSLPASSPSQAPRNTPERLIDAVERLLGQREDLDLSLREITNAAGANVAAVNYHFGSKDALVTAVIERVLTEHARQQRDALLALEAARAPASLEDLIRVWLAPTIQSSGDRRISLTPRIAARVVSGGSAELRDLSAKTHAETYDVLFRMLAERLPKLSSEEMVFRINFASVAVSGMIVGVFDQTSIAGQPPLGQNEKTLDRSVTFLVGALSAPPSRPARTAKSDTC